MPNRDSRPADAAPGRQASDRITRREALALSAPAPARSRTPDTLPEAPDGGGPLQGAFR